MESFEVQRVGTEQIRKVIAGYRPRGLFLARENGKWVAVDKTTGGAWTEEFHRKRMAIRWLRGKENVGGY